METEISIENQANKIKKIIKVLAFTVAMCLSSYIKIPIKPVPFTMQILVAVLAGLTLTPKEGLVSMAMYLIYGLGGAVVFAGPASLLSPSFGYIIGFVIMAYIISKQLENKKEIKTKTLIVASIIGLISCYTVGVTYLYAISNGALSITSAIMSGAIIFIPYDLIKIIIAIPLSKKIM